MKMAYVPDSTNDEAFGPLVERYLEAKFKSLDADGNGVLDKDEMKQIAGGVLPPMDGDKFETYVDSFFGSFDQAKGGVDLESFKAGMMPAVSKLFAGDNAGIKIKEQILVDVIQTYYGDGESLLQNDDFDALKEELTWAGSEVATISKDEIQFLEAAKFFRTGKPQLSDSEYDALKARLKQEGSYIVERKTEPVCSLQTGECSATFSVDSTRTQVLQVPGVVIASLFVISAYDIAAFVLEEALPPIDDTFGWLLHLNPLLVLLVGALPISAITTFITNSVIFKDPQVTVGGCPNCGAETRFFFGDILGVESPVADGSCLFKCNSCNSALTIDQKTLRVASKPAAA